MQIYICMSKFKIFNPIIYQNFNGLKLVRSDMYPSVMYDSAVWFLGLSRGIGSCEY